MRGARGDGTAPVLVEEDVRRMRMTRTLLKTLALCQVAVATSLAILAVVGKPGGFVHTEPRPQPALVNPNPGEPVPARAPGSASGAEPVPTEGKHYAAVARSPGPATPGREARARIPREPRSDRGRGHRTRAGAGLSWLRQL